jgi:subtilase family serine protease
LIILPIASDPRRAEAKDFWQWGIFRIDTIFGIYLYRRTDTFGGFPPKEGSGKIIMRNLSWLSFRVTAGALLCLVVLFGGPRLHAQNSRVASRITAEVNESSLATLKGNVPRQARAEYDQGEASPSTQLSHVRLVLSRSSEQQAALDQYMAELQDKSSPNYHKWLTPEEFGQLYGPNDSDIKALVAWLQSQGLTLETVSKGRTNIAFSGTVSQVEAAFHTSIHSFQANGQQFYSNTSDPRIPSALADVVKGVAHLNTIRPKPQFVRAGTGKLDPQIRRTESSGRPLLTDTYGSDFLYIVPADAATIYDTPNSYNANFTGGTSYTGAGVKIGIGGDAAIDASIVGTYRSTFLGSSTTPILNYCTSSTSCSSTATGNGWAANSGDADEAYLDTEISGGLAPGASIYYYASTDLVTGIEAAIEGNINGVTPDIFSLSFGECEQNLSTGDNKQMKDWWEQAASQGIAVTVATGDSGSAECDGDTKTARTVAVDGLSVSGFASTPYNIAVGGTDFYPLPTKFSTYAGTSLGSPGTPTYYRTVVANGPQKGYIPESTWNVSAVYNNTISANEPWSAISGGSSIVNIVAGSGGHSSCSTNNSVDNPNGSVTDGSCISGYSKPTWQTGTGTYDTDSVRDIPDVSLMAGNGYNGAATWLVCDNDTNNLAFSNSEGVLDCSNISGGYFDGFGGTSTATPAFAGILALVEQKAGSRLGQAAQTLYDLHNGGYASSIFHDVTVGNNSVPCVESSPNCAVDSEGYYFESGYNTLSGYDLATGLGSVDATPLVNYWSTANPAPYTLTATNISSLTPGATTGNTSTVTVSSLNNYAGAVTLSCVLTSPTNLTDPPTCTATSGSSTITLSSGTTSGKGSVTVSTTAATTGALLYPKLPGKGGGLLGAGGGATLAFLVFLGIPARRRSWRSMLGILVLMAALGGLAACGGGSSGSKPTSAGTTAGTYTFTVTGVGSPAISPAPTTTFTVTVN